jgi:hypothetical protein
VTDDAWTTVLDAEQPTSASVADDIGAVQSAPPASPADDLARDPMGQATADDLASDSMGRPAAESVAADPLAQPGAESGLPGTGVGSTLSGGGDRAATVMLAALLAVIMALGLFLLQPRAKPRPARRNARRTPRRTVRTRR